MGRALRGVRMGHPHAQVLGVLLCKESTDRALTNLKNICDKMLYVIFPVGQTHHSRCSGKQIPINTIINPSNMVQVETPLVLKKNTRRLGSHILMCHQRRFGCRQRTIGEHVGVSPAKIVKTWELSPA